MGAFVRFDVFGEEAGRAPTHDVSGVVHPCGASIKPLVEKEVFIGGFFEPACPEVVAESLPHDDAVVGDSIHTGAVETAGRADVRRFMLLKLPVFITLVCSHKKPCFVPSLLV